MGSGGRIRAMCLGVAVLGCGSRTTFGVTPSSDSGAPTVVITDTKCDTDRDCSDTIACTLDSCDTSAHVCVRTLRDELCDDGVYCDGDERCDVRAGCVGSASPRDCSDGIDCTSDVCNEGERQCSHAPDDMACPVSHACEAKLGCQARAFAHDDTTLYDVRIPSGEVKEIGKTESGLTDVALHPSNVLYGLSSRQLLVVDQKTGRAKLVHALSMVGGLNAGDVAPDGTLYVAGGAELHTVDPTTGDSTRVMSFPGSMTSSGDMAFIGERLVATAVGSGSDELVEFDLAARRSKRIGAIGFSCVWGLAAYGTTLYGLTCDGEILTIDTGTGRGVQIAKASVGFWGASAR